MNLEQKLEELKAARPHGRRRRRRARRERQHKEGKMSARERIEFLLDESTFEETDKLVTHRCNDFGMAEQKFYGDGFITGYGRIEGRLVFRLRAGLSPFSADRSPKPTPPRSSRSCLAAKMGAPVIGLNDSGGARISGRSDVARGLRRHFSSQHAL